MRRHLTGSCDAARPEGNFVDVKIRDPKLLHAVKAGNQVVASVTETIAVGVQHVTASKREGVV
jgi:hypothetical protein